ncbi:TonB-dependent receptor [Thalassotalea sp. 1_MG-2023]|uniref:TonB-dependent receptor family protein n=1 Tax=Thalassotalea sp. 1_MG-2023 TaxID=3062680 RepID=UPI0026E3A027|nr:TonB-dependent receptor [Thalassotalea sp. 1_MG-2023]MDO6426138.1 TonB-dependent receptor [Thalassotalea sp. 1_MG-2023]
MIHLALKPACVALAISAAISTNAFANEKQDMEHLTIFGNEHRVNDTPGSAHVLSEKELEKFDYSDIMRTLTSVPGVYVLEEDGYGLRPNIGMRGTGQNRSEKVTIMEDGVLSAPAPYASPAAYYFPTAGRMQSIEVLKGTSSAMYGPRTTGGVINLLSRQIPKEDVAGKIDLSLGQDGYGKVHGFVGGTGKNIASVFEVFRYQADGFKDINHTNKGTGFVKNDVMTKVLLRSDANTEFYQELEVKLKYADEDSDETYIGLTSADYNADPYQRYSASQLDNMATEHKQLQVNHLIQLSPRFVLGTSAYHNDFNRNWYKTSKVNGKSLGSGGVEIAAQFDKNVIASDEISVDVKANNREYLSQGIQTVLDADFNAHQVKFGLRYHEDEMDRYQWVDKYSLDTAYDMTLTSAGVPGTDSNRIDSAEALAIFVHDEYTVGDFIINAGLRYEDMTIERHDWGKSDVARTATPAHKKNDVDVWLPSLALTYRINNELLLLGGVQKGFAPPAPGNTDSENEESMNYEFGIRYQDNAFNGEAIAFVSDYKNMHGNCTASQNCDDDNIGNQYNAGEVAVSGVEVKAGYELSTSSLTIPFDLTYTLTKTEFENSFASDFWGNVTKGDDLPYLPEQQLQLTAGIVGDKWRTDLLIRYLAEMRTSAGQGNIATDDKIASRTVVDLSASYELDKSQKVKLSVDNLLDKDYMVSRTHGSIMVGKPRTLSVSYQYSF